MKTTVIKNRQTGAAIWEIQRSSESLETYEGVPESVIGEIESLINLDRQQLPGVGFDEADLRGASLYLTNLAGASLQRADLRNAFLFGTILIRANLTDADLRCASLHAADFTEANLIGVLLEGAICSLSTKWPSGFHPVEWGVKVLPLHVKR